MTLTRLRRRVGAVAALVGAAALAGLVAAPIASADASHSLIEGSGSSWSANAVNQWIADVDQNGLKVVFTANGSALGRRDFANVTNDFGITDIPFQGTDQASGDSDTNQGRAFSYLPIVAGGTAFPYQVRVAGQLVKNLRLSGQTLAKIFTGQITNWNDPAITADNNGHALPSLTIIPVVHSEGSGSTAQFTRYLDKLYPSIWRPFAGFSGLTEYYPQAKSGSAQIAQSGSDGVINYVTSSAANGAIGYDEYSYALAKGYPVVKLENQAGYFTLPNQYNVAVALTQAQIDTSNPNDPTTYLTQNLDQVYTNTDDRAYAMSSYSYAIIPTAPDDKRMTTQKRQTLVDYLYYSVCEGQKEMGPIGYSPLPVNLVQASFDQINKLKAADPNVDITNRDVTTCHNPTFDASNPSRNYLAEIAPQPDACDKVGAGPCGATTDTGTANPSGTPSGSAGGTKGSSGGTSGSGTGKGSGTGSSNGSGAGSGTGSSNGSGTGSGTGSDTGSGSGSGTGANDGSHIVVDPDTGQVVSTGGTDTGQSGDGSSTLGSGGSAATPAPTTLAASSTGSSPAVLGGLAILLVIAAIAAPPIVASRLNKGAGGGPS